VDADIIIKKKSSKSGWDYMKEGKFKHISAGCLRFQLVGCQIQSTCTYAYARRNLPCFHTLGLFDSEPVVWKMGNKRVDH